MEQDEPMLTPDKVRNHGFTKIWESPQFDMTPDHLTPHVYNSVLYAHDFRIDVPATGIKGKFDVAFAATNNNDVYAINAARNGSLAPGAVFWKAHLGRPVLIPSSSLLEGPIYMGVLSTPFLRAGKLAPLTWQPVSARMRPPATLPPARATPSGRFTPWMPPAEPQ